MNQRTTRTISALAIMSNLLFALSGCKPVGVAEDQARAGLEQGQPHQSSSASAPSVPVKPVATAEQWNLAVAQVFDKIDTKKLFDKKNPAYVKDDGETDANGVASFAACFESEPPSCKLLAWGTRDTFRKIQFFKDPGMVAAEVSAEYTRSNGTSSVDAYVSLRDCNNPSIVLTPTFRGDNWIFVEQLGIMADGAVVIERNFEHNDVDRETSNRGIFESVHVVMTEQEVDSLREVVRAKKVLIRLTGQKGYAGLDERETQAFVKGVEKLLRMHDNLGQAITRLGTVKDAACPA